MKKIEVKIPGSYYNIYLGKNIFKDLPGLMQIHKLYKNIFLIVDSKVFELHRKSIFKFYNGLNSKKHLFVFEPTEKNKTLKSMNAIFSELLKNNFSRDSLIVAVGGGITGDIAGFAAAAFARGIQFIQIPTTLLAMVDSSVGGKTGVNLGATKNIIGAFYQPKFVLIDTSFIKTLPKEEIVCGIGEIVKTGFLTGGKFFDKVKNGLPKLMKSDVNFTIGIIEECVKFKAGVVAKDEKEVRGLRKVLNLGHTFAHALEVDLKHNIKHGQAVIVGLACALNLSNKIGLINDKNLAEYLAVLIKFRPHIALDILNNKRVYEIMKRDKKNKDEKIKFVLLSGPGKIFVDVDAAKDDVIYALLNGTGYFAL